MKDDNHQVGVDDKSIDGLTRRHFLKSSSLGAAAMAVSVSHVCQSRAAEPSSDDPDQPAVESKKMKSKAKITLVQLTDNGNPDDAVRRMPQYFQQAAEYGSDLIVFPEYALGRKIPVISNGGNTGFAGSQHLGWVEAPGEPEPSRLFPRIARQGDGCVHATVNLDNLRRSRKHLRTMHQRRPDLYGLLTQDVKMWQDYPDIPWSCPEAPERVNKAQL